MALSSSPALDKIVEPLLQSREIHVLGEVRLGQREVPHEALEQRVLLVYRLDLPAIVVTVSPVDLRLLYEAGLAGAGGDGSVPKSGGLPDQGCGIGRAGLWSGGR